MFPKITHLSIHFECSFFLIPCQRESVLLRTDLVMMVAPCLALLWPLAATSEMPYSVCCLGAEASPFVCVFAYRCGVTEAWPPPCNTVWLVVWPAAETTQLELRIVPYPIIPSK